MDFRVIDKKLRYGVRVSAIIIKDGKLLTYRYEGQNHIVGGAIRVGELTEDAVKREVKEELGVDCVVKDLMYVVENRFDFEDEFHHMIEFHYKVEIKEEIPPKLIDEVGYECEWIGLENLSEYDIRPRYLKTHLLNWKKEIVHIITN